MQCQNPLICSPYWRVFHLVCTRSTSLTDSLMINIKNLSVKYRDTFALDNVSITIQKGALVAVVGANGAGKSTLLKSIMGQLKTSSGRIELGHLTPKDIAYLPQSHQIDRQFPITLREFVSAGAWHRIGFWKSFTAEPSRRNSGLEAT